MTPDDIFGTDGPAAGGGVLGGTFTSALGTLVLQTTGSYTYTSLPNTVTTTAVDSFTYTIIDGDGDRSIATLDINIAGVTLVALDDADVTVYEKALDTNTLLVDTADLATSTYTGSLPSSPLETDNTSNQLNGTGGAGLTYKLVTGGNAATAGLYGTIIVNTNGTYTYTLTKPYDDDGAGTSTDDGINTVPGLESFTYEVKDSSGNTATGIIRVNVVDDIPTAVSEELREIHEDQSGGITGNVLGNDTAGADGAVLTHVQLPGGSLVLITSGIKSPVNSGEYQFTIPGLGRYTFEANGDWKFQPFVNQNNANGVSASFTYQITDGDGDTATAEQPITVLDGRGPQDPAAVALEVDEAAVDSIGSNPSLITEIDSTPALSFHAGTDNLVSFAFGPLTNLVTDLNGDLTQDIFWMSTSTQVKGYLDLAQTTLAVTLDLNAPAFIIAGGSNTVGVTMTLSDNLSHPDGLLAQLQSIGSIGVIATDTDGDFATGTVALTVKDDIPGTMNSEGFAIVEDEQFNGPTDEDDVPGVDPDYSDQFTGSVADNGIWGADGFGRITEFTVGATVVAVPNDAAGVTVYFSSAGAYEGTAATALTAASLLVKADGSYTYTLLDNMLISGTDEQTNTIASVTFKGVDGDGDPATIALILQNKDDVATVTVAAGAATVTLDETATSSTLPSITWTPGPVIGNDLDVDGTGAIAVGSSVGAIVTPTIDYGADGAAATGELTYAFSLTSTVSGLKVTDGSSIALQDMGDGVILGVVSGGTFNGQVAIAIEIDPATGVVKVEQYLSLQHQTQAVAPDFISYDEPVALADDVLAVIVTVKDGDGDTTSTTPIDISAKITFEDAGPNANNETATLATVDDNAVAVVVGTTTGLLGNDCYGADGAHATPSTAISIVGSGSRVAR